MKFSTHVALPKHNIHVKYLPKIYMYSDVTAFCDSSLFIFKVFVKRSPNRVTVNPTDLNEIWHTRSTP